MVTLEDSRMIGCVGVLLLLISLIRPLLHNPFPLLIQYNFPFHNIPSLFFRTVLLGIMLGISGLVLILVAVKCISDVVKDPQVFKNMIIAVITGFIGITSSFLMAESYMVPLFGLPVSISSILTVLMTLWVISWITFTISGVFIKRSYDRVAELTSVNLFKAVGFLHLLGGILFVEFGGIVLFVAKVIEGVSFFILPKRCKLIASSLKTASYETH